MWDGTLRLFDGGPDPSARQESSPIQELSQGATFNTLASAPGDGMTFLPE